MRRIWWAMGVGLLVGAGVGACGDSSNQTATGSGGSAAGGAVGGSGGELGLGCDQECAPGEFCSASGQCVEVGTCGDDEDCDAGLECDEVQGVCVPGGGCGATEVELTPVPPNLMIVLDRSCSMRRDLNDVINIAGPNKWTYSVDAIGLMTTNYAGDIRFGLILFPDIQGGNCGQGTPEVAVGASNEMAIQSILTAALDTNDALYPDGPCVTNIDTAMEQAAMEPAFLDTDRDSYALLITDGKQAGCNNAGGDAGTTQILGDMAAAGVPTFVVGFGGGVDPAQLDVFAQAGGVPLMGSPAYYQADDAMQLEQALDAIASATLGCVFDLESVPPDPDQIYVFLNNDPSEIPKDPSQTNGWDYDPATNQVEFYGPLCDDLKAGTVTDVDIVFGCPQPTPD